MTFGWSFTIWQSTRVSRRSGSPSGGIASWRAMPGRTHAHRPRSAGTDDLPEEGLDPIDVRGPRQRLGSPSCRAAKLSALRTEGVGERAGERVQVLGVVHH